MGVADAHAINIAEIDAGLHKEPLVELHQEVGRDLHRCEIAVLPVLLVVTEEHLSVDAHGCFIRVIAVEKLFERSRQPRAVADLGVEFLSQVIGRAGELLVAAGRLLRPRLEQLGLRLERVDRLRGRRGGRLLLELFGQQVGGLLEDLDLLLLQLGALRLLLHVPGVLLLERLDLASIPCEGVLQGVRRLGSRDR